MNSNWAEENLQTIRTLMERSAVYRRALAPIMLFAGASGAIAAIIGIVFALNSMRAFGALWLVTALIVIVGAFIIARRQAIQDKEIFWSPPTRRIAQGLFPALAAGAFLGVIFTIANESRDFTLLVSLIWILLYGCALQAAGFFMPRGIKLFGCVFILCSCGFSCVFIFHSINFEINSHWLMGFFFGALHLFYGAYLYFTEKGKNAA